MRYRRELGVLSAAVLATAAVGRADVVTEWNQLATNAIVADIPTNVYAVNNPSLAVVNPSALGIAGSNINPNTATRDLAIQSIAVQDAVAPLLGGSQNSLPAGPISGPTDATAAAAEAAYNVLNKTVLTQLAGYTSPTNLSGVAQQQEAIWTAHLNADLAGISNTQQAINNGVAYGDSAAAAVLSNRTSDGSATPAAGPTTTQFVGQWNGTAISATNPAAQNGKWTPTPISQTYTGNPAYASALTGKTVTIDSNNDLAQYGSQPWWGGVKPFALTSASQFTPAAPPAQGSAAFNTAASGVQSLGSYANLASTDPTTEAHVHLAELWAEDIEVPIQQVTEEVAAAAGNTLAQNARLFALVNLASADARISTWSTKYANLAIRPITALNSTYATNGWQPLLTTPNHPENDSGHSATAAAAFGVLSDLYGDSIPGGSAAVSSYLYDPQTGNPVSPLNYTSFSSLISDVGESRVYGGVHFQYSIDAANTVGADVANFVVANEVAVPEPGYGSLIGLAGAMLLTRRAGLGRRYRRSAGIES
jgi:membrane-associated phospholipid phosphatase